MTTKKTAAELMNPMQSELDAVDAAFLELVRAVKQVGASGVSDQIPDGDGAWHISIIWEPTEGAKPN